MKESLLHFIWQYLHLNVKGLSVESGESLQIIRQGNYQQNAGPDFENCRLVIDDVTLIGNIEIHVRSSDWYLHRHEHDPAYNNVILHVVWEHDREVVDSNGHQLPVLTLKGRVKPGIIGRYEDLLSGKKEILCQHAIQGIPEIKLFEMIDRAVALRLEAKSARVTQMYHANNEDWEETSYQLLLENFGFKVNSFAFQHLGRKLPYAILKKHLDHPQQLEALLFGMAGFLHDSQETYQRELKAEYDFLAAKYQLADKEMALQEWKFLRLRPANFPTVRLAQLTAFLSSVTNLFGFLTAERPVRELMAQLRQAPGSYWQEHYNFGKKYEHKANARIGKQSVENICINTITPLCVAYGKYLNDETWMSRALRMLESLTPENNRIIRKWQNTGVKVASAHDSQGLIMQFNEFCLKKKCLHCAIGNTIINHT
ncbi:MAG: DUF2851 family protein [Cyclobacteriaceae bacterium]